MKIFFLRAHEEFLENPIIVDQPLLGLVVAFNHAQLISDLLLLVGKEGPSVVGESQKTTIQVCQKWDITLELSTMVDKCVADSFQRGFM